MSPDICRNHKIQKALTPEQVQRIQVLRTYAAKKQKVAQLLTQSDLPEEAALHQKAAEKALAEAAGIESRETE